VHLSGAAALRASTAAGSCQPAGFVFKILKRTGCIIIGTTGMVKSESDTYVVLTSGTLSLADLPLVLAAGVVISDSSSIGGAYGQSCNCGLRRLPSLEPSLGSQSHVVGNSVLR
jgi:hypothetical protein